MSDRFTVRARALPAALVVLAWLGILALLAWGQVAPPAPVGADAPADQFSAERALVHVRVIARQPHPAGSPANDAVREYLLEELRKIGLDPQVQSALDSPPVGPSYQLHNIIARLPGRRDGKAVMLAAHYDSAGAAPGAGDDAAGVATLLETARALRSGPPLDRDVVLLLTDAEERGMLGAKAFVDAHPDLTERIDVVLNFEARGTAGPSYMFETSPGNADLVAALADAAPRPIASSLTYEVYQHLPNNTDFTVFRDAGLRGMNFAFINGFVNYHTPQDNPENLDPRSLQHHGSYALSLARHFAGRQSRPDSSHDAVYFTLLPFGVIHYPERLVWPLTVSVLMAFFAIIAIGVRGRRLTPRGTLIGAGLFLLTGAIVVELILFLPNAVQLVHNGPLLTSARGATHNSHLYAWSFVLLSLGVTAGLYGLWLRRYRIEDLTAGAWLWWVVFLVLTSAAVPGASFMFTWPLLIGVAGMAAWVATCHPRPTAKVAVVVLASLGGTLVLAPNLFGFFTALNLRQYWIVAILLMLLLAMLLPLLEILLKPSRWAAPVGFVAAAVALMLYAGLTAPG